MSRRISAGRRTWQPRGFMWSPNRSLATVTTGFGEHIAEPSIGPFRLHTKSHIPALFEHYAPRLDAVAYRAAAEVFPMRVNNYVLRNLINWFVWIRLSKHAFDPWWFTVSFLSGQRVTEDIGLFLPILVSKCNNPQVRRSPRSNLPARIPTTRDALSGRFANHP